MRTILLLTLLLTACADESTRYQAADSSRCEGYGFTPGTDGYANCLMNMDTTRRKLIMEWASH
jgi:hypothetical protein